MKGPLLQLSPTLSYLLKYSTTLVSSSHQRKKNKTKMNPKTSIISAICLLMITASLCAAARPDSYDPDEHKHGKGNKGGGQGNNDGGFGGVFGSRSGFEDIPGLGKGWGNMGGGYGGGYGGPSGGHSRNGVIRPSVVCKEKGPCFNKKVTCPARCFSSFSHAGKGYGGGGGGGGCSMDCKKKCVAYCYK